MAITPIYRCSVRGCFKTYDEGEALAHGKTPGHTITTRYVVDYWFSQDGKLKRKRETVASQRRANAMQDGRRTSIRQGDFQPPSGVTMEAAAMTFLELEKPRLAIQTYLQRQTHVNKYIVPSFGKRLMTRLTWEEIEAGGAAWMEEFGIGAKTVATIYGTLNRIYLKVGKKHHIRYNPMTQVERPSERRSLEAIEAQADRMLFEADDAEPDVEAGKLRSIEYDEVFAAEEVQKLINAAKPGVERVRYVLAASAGPRPGELSGLQWPRVNLEEGWIEIRRSLTELPGRFIIDRLKNPWSYRRIYIGPRAVRTLREWKAACPPNEFDLVFVNQEGKPISRKSVNKTLARTCGRAGIKVISMNNLRHTFASQALLAGKSTFEMYRVMGHKDTHTTEKVYARWCKRERSDAAIAVETRYLRAVPLDRD